ncbi:MAG: hypothetical protein WCK90_03645 [archaeon]
MKELKEITQEKAKELLSGMAIMPGMEETVLESKGYRIKETRLKLDELTNKRDNEYSWQTLDGLTESETKHYLVAAGAVTYRSCSSSGGGVGKDKGLVIEFARKNNLEKLLCEVLAVLPIADRYKPGFNERNCSIVGAKIEILPKDWVRVEYIDREGNKMEEFTVGLEEKYQHHQAWRKRMGYK